MQIPSWAFAGVGQSLCRPVHTPIRSSKPKLDIEVNTLTLYEEYIEIIQGMLPECIDILIELYT